MNITKIAAAILAGTACLVAAPAFATGDFDGSETGTFGVGLTIEQECQINTSGAGLDFGNTGIIDTTLTTSSTIHIECTDTSPFMVGLSAGGSADVDARTLTDGTNTINYGLYRNAGLTQNWGVTQGVDTFDATADNDGQDITVYAKVPSHQNVPSGAYADTITATIWYDEGIVP